MLGKRFRRTTSMSQLGPACDPSTPVPQKSDRKAPATQDHTRAVVSCAPSLENAGLEALPGGRNGDGAQIVERACGWQQEFGDDIAMALENQSNGEIKPAFLHPLVPYQMGLWVGTHHHLHNMQGGGVPPDERGSRDKLLQHMRAEASISPIDFLDVCFFCKRRLKHERDIFIYRGDSAFCSEECRHRQILSDERRLLRGAAGSKRGARAASSETAVAA